MESTSAERKGFMQTAATSKPQIFLDIWKKYILTYQGLQDMLNSFSSYEQRTIFNLPWSQAALVVGRSIICREVHHKIHFQDF